MDKTSGLFVVWNGLYKGDRVWKPVGRLEFVQDEPKGFYRFAYTRGALNDFQPFVGMGDLHAIYESDDPLPLFSRRLLPKSRPEYNQYLQWCGFVPSDSPSPIDILAVTEGRKVTDYVEVFPYPVFVNGLYINRFFIHGISRLSTNELNRAVLSKR